MGPARMAKAGEYGINTVRPPLLLPRKGEETGEEREKNNHARREAAYRYEHPLPHSLPKNRMGV